MEHRPRLGPAPTGGEADGALGGSTGDRRPYKEVEHADHKHASPVAILKELRQLEDDISEGLSKLEEMLG